MLYQLNNIIKNMLLNDLLPFPLFWLEQSNGTRRSQLLHGNINGVRGAPSVYEENRDGKIGFAYYHKFCNMKRHSNILNASVSYGRRESKVCYVILLFFAT